MPPKRTYNKSRRKTYKKYGGKARVNPAATTINRIVKMAVAKQTAKYIETKTSCQSVTDYQQIAHNNFIALEGGTLLWTTQGVQDNNLTNSQIRIGDEINLKGISIRMMLELNERYSQCNYRILVIKSAKGDTPTKATLYNGLSGNKMLDTIDRERYSVIYEKWGTIKNDTQSAGRQAGQDSTITEPSTGIYSAVSGSFLSSRVTKIVKFWLPGNKLVGRSGLVRYENNSSQVKFFDYHVLIYAYTNYTTSEAIGYNVLAVNDYVKQMYFKDA